MELALLFIGVVVSLAVQGLKKLLGTTTLGTFAIVAGLSILGAGLAYYLKHLGFYENFVQILITAGAFYTFIIRTLEEKNLDLKGGLVK